MQLFANNVTTSLSAALTSTATTIQLLSLVGFPAVVSPDHLLITVTGGGNLEILKITENRGGPVTVVRGQEGTTAQAFPTNSIVSVNLTKGTLETFRDKEISLDTAITAGKPKLIGKYYNSTISQLQPGVYIVTIVGSGGGGGGGGGGGVGNGADGFAGGSSQFRVLRSIGQNIDHTVEGGTGGSGGWFNTPGCGGGGGGDGVTQGHGSDGHGGKGVNDAGAIGGHNVGTIFGDRPGDGEAVINPRPEISAGKAAQILTVVITIVESSPCVITLGQGGVGGKQGALPPNAGEPDPAANGNNGSGGFCSILKLG